jgi:hypothetical protein
VLLFFFDLPAIFLPPDPACICHRCCTRLPLLQQLRSPLKTPFREDDPPIMPPMFYFDLQVGWNGGVNEGSRERRWCAPAAA